MAMITNSLRFDPFRSVRWQAYLAVLVAALIYGTLWIAMPPGIETLTRLVNTAWHETFRFIVNFLGGGETTGMVLVADDLSYVKMLHSSPLHEILVASAGFLGVALMAAIFWYVGLTRNGQHGLLAFFGIGTFLICYFFGRDLKVDLTLGLVGVVALLVAYMPASSFVKSVVIILFAVCLTFGVLGSLPYAFVETVPSTPEPIPSDSRLIANALGTETKYVGIFLVASIVLFFAISALFCASWLHRHD